MAVSAPTDRRFRRAHVTPARRRRWVRLSWTHVVYGALATAVALAGVHRGATLLLSADALTVSRIAVRGNTRLASGEVLALLDGLQGRNMLLVELDEWRGRLLASPWVADAALRRVLPGAVDVFIVERQPIGIGRIAGGLYLIDAGGGVIDEYGPNHADFDLPIIDGLDVPGADPRRGAGAVDPERAALATRLLESLQARPDLAERVSQVDVSDARDAVVILEDDTTLIRVGDAQFAERLQSYMELAPALRERVPHIDYVDVRFGERVYVRPQDARARKTSSGASNGG